MACGNAEGILQGEETSVCLVCPMCLNGYNISECRPKLLPCDHTICLTCVKCMGDEFDCPVCQKLVSTNTLPLPTNFSIVKILHDAIENEEDSVVECCTSKSAGQLLVDGYECCCQKLVNIELEQAMLQSAKEYNIEQVDKDFDNLMNIINRRRKLLKAQLQDVYQQKEEELQDLQEVASINLMCVKKLEGTIKKLPSSTRTTAILQGEIAELEDSIEKIHCGRNLVEFQTDKQHLVAFRKYVTEFGSLHHEQAFPIRSIWLKQPRITEGKLSGQCCIVSADFEPCSYSLKLIFKDLSTDEQTKICVESNKEGVTDFEVEMTEPGMYEVYFEYDDLPLTGSTMVEVPGFMDTVRTDITLHASTSQSSDDTLVSSPNEEEDSKSASHNIQESATV